MTSDALLPRVLRSVWRQFDTILTLATAVVCTLLGAAGKLDTKEMTAAALGIVALIALSLMRDRESRATFEATMKAVLDRHQSPVADIFFNKQTAEQPFISSAVNDVMLIQETGTLIAEQNSGALSNLLKRGGRVRFVVALPHDIIAHLLAFRNANIGADAIRARTQMFIAQVEGIAAQVGRAGERLEVRYTPYPVDSTITLVDPEDQVSSRRIAVVRAAGFGVPYSLKPDYTVRGDSSASHFDHIYTEAMRVFEHSTKVVILTGESRSGKTTLIRRVLGRHAESDDIFYVISSQQPEEGERTGFTVTTSKDRTPRKFAFKLPDGSYEVDIGVWDAIADDLTEAWTAHKLVVVDEVGPMQLRSEKFKACILSAFNNPACTLFATMQQDDGTHVLIPRLKQHYRSTLVQLIRDKNTAQVEQSLDEQLRASLRVTSLTRGLYD